MLVLLLLPSVLTLKQGVTFEDIEDPNAQCIDILCYEPIMWSVDTEEVCRFRKDKECKKKCEDVSIGQYPDDRSLKLNTCPWRRCALMRQ